MYERSRRLIAELDTRFGYIADNNRDLLGDDSFPLAETVDELNAQWAYQYLIAHLSRCDEGTDRACWGD